MPPAHEHARDHAGRYSLTGDECPQFLALVTRQLATEEPTDETEQPGKEGMSRPLLKFGGGSVEILRDVGD